MIADLIEIKTLLRQTITYLTSGVLVVGTRYRIITAGTGDFSNVGATYNEVQETFVATGTTPTSWGGAKLMVISDDDFYIEELIPIVTEHVHTIAGTDFQNKDVYLLNSTLTFAAGNVQDTITVSEGFDDLYLNRYNDVKVIDSYYNDKIFTVYSNTDTVLTLDQIDTLYAESTICDIYRVDYPEGMALPFAKMVKYQLDHISDKTTATVTSEKIGKLYSVSYSETNISKNYYPQPLIDELLAASGYKNGGAYVII